MTYPKLIIIGGFAGAGKTTVVAELSKQHDYTTFSTDSINDVLRSKFGLGFHAASPIAYQILWQMVRDSLFEGKTVCIDTNMSTPQVWQSLDVLKQELPDLEVIPIILQATLETHRARVEERGRTNKTHLNLGGDAFDDVLHKYEFIEALHRPDLLRVDANGTPEEVYAAVEKLLNNG